MGNFVGQKEEGEKGSEVPIGGNVSISDSNNKNKTRNVGDLFFKHLNRYKINVSILLVPSTLGLWL